MRRKKAAKHKNHPQANTFSQQDKKLREILGVTEFRTLTSTEEKEIKHRQKEEERLKICCIENCGFTIKSNKLVKANSTLIIGDNNKN